MWGMIEVPSHLLTGEAVIVVRVKACNATGELALGEDDIPRGTRLLLTCDLEGLPDGSVVISYKWYYNCSTGRCEIQADPYYTVVNDTSWDGGSRRHTCKVEYQSEDMAVTMTGFTSHNLTGLCICYTNTQYSTNMYSAVDRVITSGKVTTGSYPANGLYYC